MEKAETESKDEKKTKEEPTKKATMRPEASSTLVFTLAGIAVGLVSLVARVRTRFMLALAIFVLIGLMALARRVYKKDWRWIASNGLFAYILTFYATWVIALNI